MKKGLSLAVVFLVLVTGCGPAATGTAPTPTAPAPVLQTLTPSASPSPSPTPVPSATDTPFPTGTPVTSYPPAGYGPANFPADVDPLTGLQVGDLTLLNRRPLAIKISNLPRDVRPQWGLSLADIVFDYYTEAGGTRFIALYYGNDASMVGPIRSARFFDAHIVRGYKAVFAFGGAWIDVLNRLETSEFANRLVLENPSTPLYRYDPNGANALMVSTSALSAYAVQNGLDNGKQDLTGMFFQLQPPAGGQAVKRIYVRFAAESYNRYDYDPSTGKYLRFEDTVDDPTNGNAEHYLQLTDRLTGQPVGFDNLVVLYVNNDIYKHAHDGSNEVIDIQFQGLGTGYAFRDGQAYKVNWVRDANDVVSLSLPGGGHYAFKPGTTIFEILGMNSNLRQNPQDWRFTFHLP